MVSELVAVAVPPCCAACRAPSRHAAAVLCQDCRAVLPWLFPARCCPRCALPLPHMRGRPCPARDAAFDAAWSAVAYAGVAREMLHALKFRAARPLAAVMAEQIAAALPASLLAGLAPTGGSGAGSSEVTMVAVPPHPVRRRVRGFDPADLLAGALARRLGVPIAPALRRRGTRSRQVGASRATRLAGERLGFQARGATPRQVLLVDDVYTTGATLDACARALRDAGAERIVAVTWARTCDAATSVENDHRQAYHR